MCLLALCAIVELWHHINVIVGFLYGSIVSRELLFLNLDESGSSRSLREYLLILILLLIHYSIFIVNGVFVVPVLFLRQDVIFE